MAKSLNQKAKLLYLMKLFFEKTDENHGLGMSGIINELGELGINAERKSIYDDIEILRNFGMDIRLFKGKRSEYRLVNRNLSFSDVKLLTEIIQSTPYITANKMKELIRKLQGHVSEYERQLQQPIQVINRIKNRAESLFFGVEKILAGIEQGRKISFRYFLWKADLSTGEGVIKKSGKEEPRITVSPWTIFFYENLYFMAGMEDGSEEISLWRVDRMEQIYLENEDSQGRDVFEQWEPGLYFDTRFGMNGGEVGELLFECDEVAIDLMVDLFGKDVKVEGRSQNTKRILVSAYAAVNAGFFGWLFSVADQIKLVGPEHAVAQFGRSLKNADALYQ